MSIFDHENYKSFVHQWVEDRPRGEYRRIAEYLRVSSTMVSQVFKGDKELNLEMAAELCGYFTFNEKEERYFFLLVELGRAGSQRLREKLNRQLRDLGDEAKKIVSRVASDKELSPEDKAIYYSSWLFTGLRNLLAIPHSWTVNQLATILQVPENQVRLTIQFLLEKGLLALKDGRYEILAKATHLGVDSPLVNKHHQNWRIRGIQKMDQREANHLFYTGPMSLSQSDAEVVRQMFLELIQKVNQLVVNSPSETVRCMNIDWFEY